MTTLTKQDETLFRIGGVYRQNDGDVVRLEPILRMHESYAATLEWVQGGGTPVQAQFIDRGGRDKGVNGWRRLVDGKYPDTASNACYGAHLIPGELHQVNGEWVPVEEKKEESISRRVDKWIANLAAIGAIPAKPAAEPKRAPLDWAKRVHFDNFKGFEVRKWADFGEMASGNMEAAHSHPLQLMSDRSNPLHGSAHLQRKAD